MAKTSDKVMQMVREEIEKNPNITTSELYEKAKEIDEDVAGMGPRQFNARYPLQIKRRKAPARRKGRGKTRRPVPPSGDRAAVRAVLLQLSQDVAGAESGAELVAVIGGLDDYVDRVLRAAGMGASTGAGTQARAGGGESLPAAAQ